MDAKYLFSFSLNLFFVDLFINLYVFSFKNCFNVFLLFIPATSIKIIFSTFKLYFPRSMALSLPPNECAIIIGFIIFSFLISLFIIWA